MRSSRTSAATSSGDARRGGPRARRGRPGLPPEIPRGSRRSPLSLPAAALAVEIVVGVRDLERLPPVRPVRRGADERADERPVEPLVDGRELLERGEVPRDDGLVAAHDRAGQGGGRAEGGRVVERALRELDETPEPDVPRDSGLLEGAEREVEQRERRVARGRRAPRDRGRDCRPRARTERRRSRARARKSRSWSSGPASIAQIAPRRSAVPG